MHILCICFNRISVVSDDVQELEVYRKENEMENSCSNIGEEHRVDGLQGKLAVTSYSIYEITLNFRCCLSRLGKIPTQFDRSLIVNPVYHSRTCVPTDEDLVENCGNESAFEDSGDEERGIDALKGILLDKHWII